MTEGPRISVVLVDDSADIRNLVRLRLETTGRFDVVSEGRDGLEATSLAHRLKPDVMVLDVSMPNMDGLEALPGVLKASPKTIVVMFTGFDSPELVKSARELGAAAVLQKGSALRQLPGELIALVEGSAGQVVVPPPLEEDEALALAQHAERFREMVENAAIGMATVTLAGRIGRINRAGESLLVDDVGAPLIGRFYWELIGGIERTQVRLAMDAVAAGAPPKQVEHHLPLSQRVGMSSISAVTDDHGRPLYLVVQVQDVSDIRDAEEALRTSEDVLRLLVASVVDYAIFVLDPVGRITTWNPGAERMKGYSEHEIIGRHFRVFYPPEAQDAMHPEEELELAQRDGRYEEEGWRVRKDGSQFWANVVITPLYGRNGALVGFGKVTRDLSRDARAERGVAAIPASGAKR